MPMSTAGTFISPPRCRGGTPSSARRAGAPKLPFALSRSHRKNQAQIARTIVAATAYDIPQVTAILRWAIEVASQAEGRPVCPPDIDLLDLLKDSEEMTWKEIVEETEWWESLLPYLDQAENKLTIARYLPPAIRISAKPSLVTLDHPRPL